MHDWNDTLFQLSNQSDPPHLANLPKPVAQHLNLTSPARFTLMLSRLSIDTISKSDLTLAIQQQYGLEEEELEIVDISVEELNKPPALDFEMVLNKCQVKADGDVKLYKESVQMTAILGMRILVNDGNTIIAHFWDSGFHYVLFNEMKY